MPSAPGVISQLFCVGGWVVTKNKALLLWSLLIFGALGLGCMVECHGVVSACFNSRPVRCCLIRAAYSARALLDSSSQKVRSSSLPRLGIISSYSTRLFVR